MFFLLKTCALQVCFSCIITIVNSNLEHLLVLSRSLLRFCVQHKYRMAYTYQLGLIDDIVAAAHGMFETCTYPVEV